MILDHLNDRQKEAVVTTEGPVLIIAGAGSGKTRALTHRIAHIIKEKNIAPWNVLAVTFTNKAAEEMKVRLRTLLGITDESQEFSQLPTMGTFHSVCVRILRKEIHHLGYEQSFVIYDDLDQLSLTKRIMKELQIPDKNFNPRSVLGAICAAKGHLVGASEYRSKATSYFEEHVARVYVEYQKALCKANALDFDDLLMVTVELFEKHEQILMKYQDRFEYIHIDEYQDTNYAQYVFVKQLAAKNRNICVVGDPDQSIYSWRGADIRNILSFEKDYPEAKTILLEENYRSTGTILDGANAVIAKNRGRFKKDLWTKNPKGEKIMVHHLETEKHEADWIISEIREMHRPLKDFVILYRTNAQSRIIEEGLLRAGLPYKIIGGVKFYSRKEIKDMISYLRLIQNPRDDASLLRIINVPARKIGAKTIEQIESIASQNNLSLFEALPRMNTPVIRSFHSSITALQNLNKELNASHLLKEVIDRMGYRDFLQDGTEEGEMRMENVRELISVAQKYDGLEGGVSLATFLEEIALVSDLDQLEVESNFITLMTMHSAKGLEYPVVFISGMEEGVFPHSRALIEPHELEEERRLAYVGMTRAREKLFLTRAKQRLLYGEFQANAPSQFLYDVPSDLVNTDPFNEAGERGVIETLRRTLQTQTPQRNLRTTDFKDGDRIRHQKFGDGMIVSLQGDIATVAFEDQSVGLKKLALNVAPVEKI